MPDPRSHGRWPLVVALLSMWSALLVACGGGTGDPELVLSSRAEQGRTIVETRGCAACHGADGRGVTGPSWDGLPGATVDLEDGTSVVADEAYLRTAILDPAADIRTGFELEMPQNDLTEAEVDLVIAYMKELP